MAAPRDANDLQLQTIVQQDQRAAIDVQTRRTLASVIEALGGGSGVSKLPLV